MGAYRSTLTPEQLWHMAPDQRSALVGGALGVQDALMALAGGKRAVGAFKNVEHRATIRGGIAALNAAGIDGFPSPKGLHSRIVQKKDNDQQLIKAAGGGRDLANAANKIRERVQHEGLSRAAWGYRGLYLLDSAKGVGIVRGVAGTAANFIPGVGQIISAGLGVKGAADSLVANNLKKQLMLWAATARKKSNESAFVPSTQSVLAQQTYPDWVPAVAVGVAAAFFLYTVSKRGKRAT